MKIILVATNAQGKNLVFVTDTLQTYSLERAVALTRVGELRSSPLPKEKIRQIYNGGSIRSFNGLKHIPLQVLFFDEERWTMNAPLGDWWDEWYGNLPAATTQTVYFVFASQEGYPHLEDLRCDD